jgi:hypothetical protein
VADFGLADAVDAAEPLFEPVGSPGADQGLGIWRPNSAGRESPMRVGWRLPARIFATLVAILNRELTR